MRWLVSISNATVAHPYKYKCAFACSSCFLVTLTRRRPFVRSFVLGSPVVFLQRRRRRRRRRRRLLAATAANEPTASDAFIALWFADESGLCTFQHYSRFIPCRNQHTLTHTQTDKLKLHTHILTFSRQTFADILKSLLCQATSN